MKENIFIYFDSEVVNEILKVRDLQTSEFKYALEFVEALFSEENVSFNRYNISVVKNDEGTYCFRNDKKDTKGVVFDLELLSDLKLKEPKDKLVIILKVLRFSIKIWNNHPMTNSELKIQDSTSYCLMPLSYAVSNYYKILVETKPDQHRLERRNQEYLLCFKDGHNKTPVTDASVTNLRKAIFGIDIAFKTINNKISETPSYDFKTFSTSSQTIENENRIKDYIGFDNWQEYITEKQKNFIQSSNLGPARIEGPAGSGKTLSLILRSIYLLRKHEQENLPFHIIFFTHSIATKENIKNILESELDKSYFDRHSSIVSIKITTLLEWCIENTGVKINIEDCLEPDALDSKQMQLLYIEEAFKRIYENEYEKTFKNILSTSFQNFLEKTEEYQLYDSFQKEFTIFIKGQANQDLDKYKELEKSVFPIFSKDDKGFIFKVFDSYQKRLEEINQFDVDDVILTTIGSLNTPIWRRVRNTNGFDYIILDETQLFNFNELSILQYVNKEKIRDHICFSQDISQTLGDTGFESNSFEQIGEFMLNSNDSYNFGTIFRCSPEIAEVAFKVLTSGPILLTHKKNPLENIEIVSSNYDNVIMPYYFELNSDDEMIEFTYKRIDKLVRHFGFNRSEILIVVTEHRLFELLEKYGKAHNKPILFIEKRGDTSVVRNAKSNGMYVASVIDFVGGLEFDAVIIVGVDGQRVPPNNEKTTHFQEHAWVNKMYVAVTRARKLLEVYGNRNYPQSVIITSSLNSNALVSISI